MFRSNLILEVLPQQPGLWVLKRPLRWDTGALCDAVTVPAGTVTDLASVPQLLQNPPVLRWFVSLNPTGRSRRPAVLHDFLYNGGKFACGRMPTRAEADKLLRHALRAEGSGPVEAAIFWVGVRVGGRRGWREGHAKGLKTA